MIKVIKRTRYNTDTAFCLASWESTIDVSDFNWYQETLYKTPKGNLFLYGEGNCGSPYKESIGDGFAGGEQIIPYDEYDAVAWLEKRDEVEVLEKYFPHQVRDA